MEWNRFRTESPGFHVAKKQFLLIWNFRNKQLQPLLPLFIKRRSPQNSKKLAYHLLFQHWGTPNLLTKEGYFHKKVIAFEFIHVIF